nr:hypothetical protein [uncultured Oscillibacter sp.]
MAAEQNILLRWMEQRKGEWLITVGFCFVMLLGGVFLAVTGEGPLWLLMILGMDAVLLAGAAWNEYRGGDLGTVLAMQYGGDLKPTAESDAQLMRLTFQGDTCLIARSGAEIGTWECERLKRASESDTTFLLRRGAKYGWSTLTVPKTHLKEGNLADFRKYLDARLKGRRTVRYYAIPERLQKRLEKARKPIYQKIGRMESISSQNRREHT